MPAAHPPLRGTVSPDAKATGEKAKNGVCHVGQGDHFVCADGGSDGPEAVSGAGDAEADGGRGAARVRPGRGDHARAFPRSGAGQWASAVVGAEGGGGDHGRDPG